MNGRWDIVIAGGGPAGATAARRLAATGLTVALIDPDETRPRLEGMSERVAALLLRDGFDLGDAGVGNPVPRIAYWSGNPVTANQERLVDRATLDRALRKAAARAGAGIFVDRIRRIERHNDHSLVETSTGRRLSTRLVIDARGRRAPVADGRKRGPATLSVAAMADGLPLDRSARVVPLAEGWVWLVGSEDGRHWVQVNFDADAAQHGRPAALAMWRRILTEALTVIAPGSVLPASAQAVAPIIRNADSVLSAPELDPHCLRIGDAAAAADPLSGSGLFWAISSGLSAVPLAAALLDGGDAALGRARTFYRDRIVGTFWRQARLGRDFYRMADRFADEPFWAARTAWPDDRPAHAAVATPRIEQRVIVQDHALAEADVVVTSEHPEGAAFVAGQPIAPVARAILSKKPRLGLDIVEIVDRHMPGADDRATDIVLDWLSRQGLCRSLSPSAPPVHR